MKYSIFVPMIFLVLALTAFISCGDDDPPPPNGKNGPVPHHCVDDVALCNPNWWSCAEANLCYATLNDCIESGECS